MRTLDIPVPPSRDLTSLPAQIMAACAAVGLRATLDGTQKSYPGSRHWHYQRAQQTGTLELTWWPAQRRLWIKVASGRASAWIDELLPGLQAALAEAVQALPVLVAD
jgi:hypothetical protein